MQVFDDFLRVQRDNLKGSSDRIRTLPTARDRTAAPFVHTLRCFPATPSLARRYTSSKMDRMQWGARAPVTSLPKGGHVRLLRPPVLGIPAFPIHLQGRTCMMPSLKPFSWRVTKCQSGCLSRRSRMNSPTCFLFNRVKYIILLHAITYYYIHIHTYIHTDRQTDRQTDKQTNTQTDRQTDRQTNTYIHTYIHTYKQTDKPYLTLPYLHNIPYLTLPSIHVYMFTT